MAYTTPEKKVQNKILDYLKKLKNSNVPIYYERRQAGGVSYKKGVPDIYVVYKGYHIEIEVKAENGHLSTMQEKYKNIFENAGSLYINAYNYDEFENFFNNIK